MSYLHNICILTYVDVRGKLNKLIFYPNPPPKFTSLYIYWFFKFIPLYNFIYTVSTAHGSIDLKDLNNLVAEKYAVSKTMYVKIS